MSMSNRIQTDGVPDASAKFYDVHPNIHVQTASTPSGALGRHLSAPYAFDEEHHGLQGRQYVSQQQAENALQQLMSSGSAGAYKTTLRDVMEMDPMVLSMMVTQLVLSVSSNTASSMCKQLERATDVQTALRNKQVAEYQEQISKSIEQADQARKAGLLSAVFDWIIGGVEAVVGVLKIMEGIVTADPLAIADGAAYLAAGVSGMVKAAAETAMALGADKDTCKEVIKVAGNIQSVCEGVALALDIIQIGRGICAARALTKAAGEVLEKEVGTKLIEAVSEGAENKLKALAEEVGKEISQMISENIGKSFTQTGIETLVKSAIEQAGKELLNKSADVVAEKLRDAILQKLRRSIISTIIRDCSNRALLVTRACAGGMNKISMSIVASRTAELQRTIEKLIVQQGFIDFMQNWTEDRKKTQQKRLSEAYQDGANAMKSASEMIDNYGTVLANIAGARA